MSKIRSILLQASKKTSSSSRSSVRLRQRRKRLVDRLGAIILMLPMVSFLSAQNITEASDQLKAGIQHFESSIDNMQTADIQASKSALPLDKQLWRGNQFNRDATQKLLKDSQANENFWYRVPNWLAGRWEASDATTFYMRDHQTGKIENARTKYQFHGRETIGHQFDRQHCIWTYCRENVWTRGQTQDSETHSLLFYQHPLRVTQKEAVVMGRMAVFEVNGKGKIVSSYKSEVIDTMTLQDEDTMKDEQIKIVFDEKGKSVTSIKTEVIWKRIADFQPIEEIKGVQLKPLFKRFLSENGKRDLIEE